MRFSSIVTTLLAAALLTACGGNNPTTDVHSSDASDIGSNTDVAGDGADTAGCLGAVCNGVCCQRSQLCRYDTCVDDLGRCTAGDASVSMCPSDSYCDAMGYCTPYGVPPDHDHDPSCTARQNPAPLVPFTQCTSTVGDMDGTPVVADLGFLPRNPDDAAPHPTIVAAVRLAAGSQYSSGGYIYLFDGTTCAVQSMLDDPSQVVAAAGTPAIGDLDLDGRPEIVAGSGTGGIIAFHFDTTMMRWTTLWHSDMSPGPFTGPAPALADLGGDGHPEIVLGGYVYDWQGHLLDGSLGELPYQSYSTPVALADVDLDGHIELVGNNGIYQLDASNHFVRESYDTATAAQGFVAVADFGNFPGSAGDAPGRPEIVFYQSPRVIVRTIGGDTVFSADASALAGGGPPAVADVDGDGKPEIIIAGHAMAAFDPDCVASPTRGGRCASGRTDGILWIQTGLQDGSSAINGCTAFDFDGDGRVEVVEADECFTRIFDGTTGNARWSAPRFSCTFIEMPIVADVNGDNAAEIVVPANNACAGSSGVCGLATGAPDPILPGFECSDDSGCPMATHCLGRLCRCTADTDCGPNNVCTPPPNSDGQGNVCRSSFEPSVGLKVYGDQLHRWVPSRPVWNQYSYVITNVDDRGAIPTAASSVNNWQVGGLNNYRQNTQGALGDGFAPDLTIAPSPSGCLPTSGGALTLRARFCNRGTGIAGANSSVSFRAIGGDGGSTPLCTAIAMTPINAGQCVDVSCTATFTPDAMTSIEAVADANDQVLECYEDDNTRAIYRPGDCLP